jgi:hypothetical protein
MILPSTAKGLISSRNNDSSKHRIFCKLVRNSPDLIRFH